MAAYTLGLATDEQANALPHGNPYMNLCYTTGLSIALLL
jgi:hypothetical protein